MVSCLLHFCFTSGAITLSIFLLPIEGTFRGKVYHHDLLPSRGTISKAVRFALSHGWCPEHKGSPPRLTFAGREQGFQVVAQEPHRAGASNGAVKSSLQIGRPGRAVPDQRRSPS